MNKIFIILLLITELFSNCKIDLVALNSGAENAVDYAQKGNHKYALIEIGSAITYGTQALESCKGKISSNEMDEISKNLASLKDTKKKIENKLTPKKVQKQIDFLNGLVYALIKDNKTRDSQGNYVKRSIDVTLNRRASSEELSKLALMLKDKDIISYKRTFIGYYLKDTDQKQGYWATTNFNPNLEVHILGLSIEAKKRITEKSISTSDKEIIGSWLDNRPYVGHNMILYYKQNRFYLDSVYETYTSTKEMSFENIGNGIKIVDIKGGHFGEYFLLTKQGALEFWNKTKSYYTAKRLDVQISKISIEEMMKQWNATAYKKDEALRKEKALSKKTKEIEVQLEYYRKGVETYFEGKTNLPEHTKIGIQLNGKAHDFDIFIKKDGSFVSAGMTYLGNPLVGKYKVVIMVYNNKFAQTKDIQEKLEEYGVKKKSNINIIKNFFF